ncbi:hypothetical protein SDC9_189242 [bioreactor metagenome]|uniref:Uncharacterized protein n=1 Tax=bioreactor metagenome TaxID=1076179 RepID=A0A645HRY5_9ZZZZ
MEVKRTKFIDFGTGARCLAAELITGEIQDFQPLIFEFIIQLLQSFVLRCKTALGRGVDNQQNFIFKCSHGNNLIILI